MLTIENRGSVIQSLIDKTNAKSYLEIGLGKGEIFNAIKCEKMSGVDPKHNIPGLVIDKHTTNKTVHKMTSDVYFHHCKDKHDVIFVDGLHKAEQVERDINNALAILNDNGYIICHDMNPTDVDMQKMPRVQGIWTGDCWKAWVKIRSSNPNLSMFVVDIDYGCGVITRGSQQLLDLNGLSITYENFENNRTEWLNLVSVADFIEML